MSGFHDYLLLGQANDITFQPAAPGRNFLIINMSEKETLILRLARLTGVADSI
jgi:hypothetical protein